MMRRSSKTRRVISGCAITSILFSLLLCGSLGVAVVGMNQSVWFGNGTSYLVIGREPQILDFPGAIILGPQPASQSLFIQTGNFVCRSGDFYSGPGHIQIMT